MTTGIDEGRTGIYVHIPFCQRKCLYCDFLSAPAGEDVKKAYMDALTREIRSCGEKGTEADTVFIGGGTPTTVDPSALSGVFDEIYKVFRVSPEAEITIEANPGTLSFDKLKMYRRMGINRLSIGLQSTDDNALKVLGRIHTYDDFRESFDLAREAGFDNINLDLMFALPGQTREGWSRTLRQAAALKPEHISAYSLIVEEGTPFAKMKLDLPDEDTEYRMYDDTADILKEYGFHRYEISNYATLGRECRHNSSYWTGKDYVGFGVSAASLRHGQRYSVTDDLQWYIRNADDRDLLLENVQTLTQKDRMEEFMFLGLRMTAGVEKEEFQRRFGHDMEEVYGNVLMKHTNLGLLAQEDGRVFLTDRGIHVSNRVMADFLLDEEDFYD